ncbi:hypothetical protein CPWG_00049 [Cyanophage MED4-117]|uniref:hypothetical protein n=1 Tax=Cyanophage MED4-117 TaxID=889954 RepID=UPI0002C0D6F1|nr:hypothetical protein CPWG_00049 [Cyanophage MED4-117]AGH16160.1 hypothetical protein CPWG_00049 [Cyanophage MED4-117]
MALEQVVLPPLLFKSKLTRLWLLVLLVLPLRTLATPVVPQFRSGSSTMSSTSQSIINETITSHQYNSGFSYSASGHNIESADLNGYINPATTSGTTQTLNGVQFSWTSPTLEDVPRWKIVNAGQNFSLVESLQGAGLSNVTTINRTITTTTTTETTSVFGQ